ncbi:transcriptional regulator [Burkholderia multivorans]|uniref:transcriptional regulator n=2 Tax=Burkholderia multivorans TaxID=87883 RepID=UPI000CFE68C3|nr:transcriptional regulator [Burkholderia multivorans]MBU9652821.1 transcriptional regulator [Burkholderia multivorans]MCO1382026.1 transcriptional regulator [Burkholderia multivorans]MDN7971296.1 transcriptional regulator [Burkholderia multivorans]PRH12758.1 transcriptional regulator [Burkholderia multivorans]QIX17960.1 transcriptional regulator [Burkholderia multivorans]
MKDRDHEEAMAELFRNDPELAAAVLSAVESDGDHAELAIIRRQLANAAGLAPKGRTETQP